MTNYKTKSPWKTFDENSDDSIEYSFSGCEERDEVIFDHNIRYKGQWKGNKKFGYGVQVWGDGETYKGYWVNDLAHGHGKLHY